MELPYLTSDLPGIGGLIKQRVEDFRVEEIPLYEACGEGTHVYFRVEKAGIATPAAVERIARYMDVRPSEIGVAGLKDARAVSVQMMSLEHADPRKLLAFNDRGARITWTSRHTNKLRPGHLAGNRFTIRIRQAGEAQLAPAREVLEVLSRRGVPNYFGPQRFGARGDTATLGEALVRNDPAKFIAIYLGRAMPDDPPDCKAARDAFDVGAFDRARKCWPRHYANERRALAAYRKSKKPGRAITAIDRRMKRLYVSAFQSRIFNEVLVARIGTIDHVFAGDMAQKTDTGGVFRVTDEAAEAPRAAALEISPTGPLFGFRCNLADGEPGRIEREVIDRQSVTAEEFRHVGALKVKGGRRPLRFVMTAPHLTAGADGHGQFLELAFGAPSGCYATIVVQEIMKAD